LKPAEIKRGERSSRLAKNGNAFRMERDRAETVIFTQNQLLLINDEDKEFQRVEVVKPSPPDNNEPKVFLFGFPALYAKSYDLPFSLHIRAEQLKEDWQFRVMNRVSERIALALNPRNAQSRAMCTECWVKFDEEPCQVSAIKYFDPAGNLEVVYKINKRILNKTLPPTLLPYKAPREFKLGSAEAIADLFNPDLEAQGYKELLPTVKR
jgi:hypothetical protein